MSFMDMDKLISFSIQNISISRDKIKIEISTSTYFWGKETILRAILRLLNSPSVSTTKVCNLQILYDTMQLFE